MVKETKISVDGSKTRSGGMPAVSFHGPHPSVDKQGGAWLNPHFPAREYLVVLRAQEPTQGVVLKDDGQETVGALDLSKSKQAELGRDAQDSEKLEQK